MTSKFAMFDCWLAAEVDQQADLGQEQQLWRLHLPIFSLSSKVSKDYGFLGIEIHQRITDRD